MKKNKIHLYIAAIIVVIALLYLVYLNNPSKISYDYLNLDGKKINLEIARTSSEREIGLMYRESLCSDCGMLFIFDGESFNDFWMKNTLIPLQIIHINKDSVVVEIIDAEPCDTSECKIYRPNEKSLYVLEVNKGTFNSSIIGKEADIFRLKNPKD